MDLRPEQMDPVPADLPNHFSLYNPTEDPALPWWHSLNNAELNQLIERGLEGNLSLQEAWARLSQARALATAAKADQYPDLWADGTAAHLRTDNSDTGQQTSDNFSLGLRTGYELDLWGRVQAKVRGAELDFHASREDINTLLLSLSGLLSETWVELLSQRQHQQQLEQELADNTWLSGPASSKIVFDTPSEQRWQAAAALLGVDLNLLSSDAGHA